MPAMVARDSLMRRAARGKPEAAPLSTREAEVLRQMSRGLTNRELAQKLFITEGTTKGHLHRIFRKLGVRNRTAAVARARELGLL
jgi:ATP/maltotriose-dependent transcriptional regulator MalT